MMNITDFSTFTEVAIAFSREHLLGACIGIIAGALVGFVFFRNRSEMNDLENNTNSIIKELEDASDNEIDFEKGVIIEEKVVVIKTMTAHDGVSLRVKVLPVSADSSQQLLLYASNDDYDFQDTAGLVLLQNEDELNIKYFAPDDEADKLDIFRLVEWEITKLTSRT